MNPARAFFAFSVLSYFLVVAPSAFSAVEVVMKNGREIYADDCKPEGARLKCFKADGVFYLDESDIDRVRETSGDRSEEVSLGQSPLLQDRQDDGTAGGKKPTPEKRIDEINRRKKELMSEREILMKERQILQEDIKKAPDWMPVKQFEDLKKRNAEIDSKIEKFNEEVTRLDSEEKGAGKVSKSPKK